MDEFILSKKCSPGGFKWWCLVSVRQMMLGFMAAASRIWWRSISELCIGRVLRSTVEMDGCV